jgi:membrane associated rhomboid family serine protease
MAALAILAATVLVSLAGFASQPLLARCLFRPYWFAPQRQYWTLISSGLVHANLTHLLFNGLSYWFFALPLQRAIGQGRFVALYFLGLVLSNGGTWIKHRREPGYATLGASGAVTAVLFAAIVYYPRSSIALMLIPVPIPAPLFAVLYLAFTYYSARRARGPINHDAHLDGALVGLAFVALTDPLAWARAWQLLIR